MKKKELMAFMFIILLFFLVTNISGASLGIFPQDSTISLHQVCSNCTFVNLTSITFPATPNFPTGIVQQFDLEMTKTNFDYNFTFSNTSLLGIYSYNTCGDPDGIQTCENIDFTINKLGEALTTGQGIIYILLTALIFILFVFVLYINIAIPYSNETDQFGGIIKVTRRKYIKIALVPVTHALLNLFLNLLLSISNNLLGNFDIYYGTLSFLAETSIRLSWPIFIVVLIWVMIEWIRDLEWNKQIKKFGSVTR